MKNQMISIDLDLSPGKVTLKIPVICCFILLWIVMYIFATTIHIILSPKSLRINSFKNIHGQYLVFLLYMILENEAKPKT